MQRSVSPPHGHRKERNSFSSTMSPPFDPRSLRDSAISSRLPSRSDPARASVFSASTGTSQSTSTMLDAQTSKPSSLVLKLTAVASLSGFLFGYDTGYISSVLVTIGSDLDNRPLTIEEKDWITSATSLGALIAVLFAGPAADIIGRKTSVLVCDILFVIGAIIQYLTTHVHEMILGRFIMGCGVGIGSLIAPLFISELAPGKFRGRLVITNCLAITGGQMIAYGMGALFAHLKSGWRYMVALSLLPCILQFVSMLFLPDTPRFMIMQGKYEEASSVLRQVYPSSSQELIDANIEELYTMNGSVPGNSVTKKLKNSFRELFATPSSRRALFIGCGLQAAQQFVGFNALMYFSGTIFEMAGFTNSTDVSCVTAATNFLFTMVALVIIDKVGRRNILLYSMPLLMVAQLVCALAFYHLNISIEDKQFHSTHTPVGSWSIVVMLAVIGFVAFYAVGLGNVPWQQSELFPQSVRGVGSSLTTATNWFGSMTISATFLRLMEDLTPAGTFSLFAAITALSLVAIYFTYPEMGGMQLEEIEQLLSDGFNVKKSVQMHKARQEFNSYVSIPDDYME